MRTHGDQIRGRTRPAATRTDARDTVAGSRHGLISPKEPPRGHVGQVGEDASPMVRVIPRNGHPAGVGTPGPPGLNAHLLSSRRRSAGDSATGLCLRPRGMDSTVRAKDTNPLILESVVMKAGNVTLARTSGRGGSPSEQTTDGEASAAGASGDLTVRSVLRALARKEEKLDVLCARLSALERHSEGPEFLTVAQVAERLGRTPFTIRKWLREGRLDGSKGTNGRSGRYLIARAEIDAVLGRERDHG
ncbi:MAG: helix-turn-helix domain-containing protein [Planctomycetes bacterium]|nr:helix-turn-helix domain-containing protein [Planctomycetota bacterium]